MRWLRRLLKPRIRRKEANRIANLQAVRIEKREDLPGFYYYGDIEFNRRRAEDLRRQAQKDDG